MSGNALKRFRGLLPSEPTFIGTVQIVNINGTVEVLLIGGGRVTVSGTGYAPGARVFIKGEEVLRSAPALPTLTIEV